MVKLKDLMNDLKYIIVRLPGMETASAIVFRGCITHKDMVPKKAKVLFAGFCKIQCLEHNMKVKTFGSSDSLGVGSLPENGVVVEDTLMRTHSYVTY